MGHFDKTLENFWDIYLRKEIFDNFGGHHCPLSGQFWTHWRPTGDKMNQFVCQGKPCVVVYHAGLVRDPQVSLMVGGK